MMLVLLSMFLVLQYSSYVYSLDRSYCAAKTKPSVYKDGEMVVAAFFPLFTIILDSMAEDPRNMTYYIQLNSKNYQIVLAMVFAIEEINQNPHLLPNVSLGYDIYNVLFTEWWTLDRCITWLSGPKKYVPNYTCRREMKSVAVLTGVSGIISSHIATLLELYKYPQLAIGSFDLNLNNHDQFPDLYQMASKDTSLPHGIVSLLNYFHWNWVGLIVSEGQKGVEIISDLGAEMDKNRICVDFVEMLPVSEVSYLASRQLIPTRLLKSSANVIIAYGDSDFLRGFLFYLKHSLVTMKVWIMNSEWDVFLHSKHFILQSFHGSLIFTHHHKEISDFKNFIQTVHPSKYPEDFYLTRFWFYFFNCSFADDDCNTLENCVPNVSLLESPKNSFDVVMSEYAYNTYNAVYAVAHSLHEMLFHQVEVKPIRKAEDLIFSSWQLHPFLKNMQFTNPAGEQVILDEKMKLNADYDILNYWNFPEGLGLKVKVGQFSPYGPLGQQLSLSEDMIEWATEIAEIPQSVCSESCGPGFRKSLPEGSVACCFVCTPCPENEISNETDMDQCVKCPDHQYVNTERNHCLEKSMAFLDYDDPLGIGLSCTALCFSALSALVLGIFVKKQDTPIVKANNRTLSYILLITLNFCFLCSFLFIGHPNTATCILQQTTFGVLFTVAVSTVLAKTITVVLAYKVTAPGRRIRWLLVTRAPNFIVPICTLIQIILCGVWLGKSPPFIDTDALSEHEHIIVLCNKGSVTAFYCMLGYLGALALGSFIVAFLARNLPDTFNEAKFLTFSMLVFCSVWVTFLPVYHSTKGKVMVAVEVFSILASSAGLLGCIFAPKCYIILLRPQRNSIQGLRDKIHYRYKA
ncbi:vomeronasal type-2 receptor 116 isoform X2 [Cricetulus griseus]|uniref:Vomeronasal type-2 receptor 116 isoform X2 n=1 Tax=Cricetulus griseus TaxID=10029 RepID=A0A9J7FZ88_CRIGR|nr:vomeronasal type-2 receptor 116 isoform X2 [Cricetulus griseus]